MFIACDECVRGPGSFATEMDLIDGTAGRALSKVSAECHESEEGGGSREADQRCCVKGEPRGSRRLPSSSLRLLSITSRSPTTAP